MNYQEIVEYAEVQREQYRQVEENTRYTKTVNKIEKLRNQISKLEGKLDKYQRQHYDTLRDMPFSFGSTVLTSIAKELISRNEELTQFEILGSFGMNCEYGLWLFTEEDYKKYKETNSTSHITYSLTFFNNGEVATGKYLNKYPKGSIGELNGGNYEVVPIESIEQLDKIMKDKKAQRQ